MKELGPQRFVQAALPATITADDTEVTIASRAVEMMQDRGVQDTWYHKCPALVLLGTRSCLSVSGRDYVPADEPVGSFNLITVDLSPALDGVWGDCARSFYVENGRCVDPPSLPEFARGAGAEKELHETSVRCAHPALTFHELFQIGNQEIARLGFENLDFRGNLGHTIGKELRLGATSNPAVPCCWVMPRSLPLNRTSGSPARRGASSTRIFITSINAGCSPGSSLPARASLERNEANRMFAERRSRFR